ncbi:hypothetical protein BDQ17DRAFT_1356409 [Cyathus striatus]|nr:hypothetical protein BDQ17DRAFT_1356409 [Cyathus striatus]
MESQQESYRDHTLLFEEFITLYKTLQHGGQEQRNSWLSNLSELDSICDECKESPENCCDRISIECSPCKMMQTGCTRYGRFLRETVTTTLSISKETYGSFINKYIDLRRAQKLSATRQYSDILPPAHQDTLASVVLVEEALDEGNFAFVSSQASTSTSATLTSNGGHYIGLPAINKTSSTDFGVEDERLESAISVKELQHRILKFETALNNKVLEVENCNEELRRKVSKMELALGRKPVLTQKLDPVQAIMQHRLRMDLDKRFGTMSRETSEDSSPSKGKHKASSSVERSPRPHPGKRKREVIDLTEDSDSDRERVKVEAIVTGLYGWDMNTGRTSKRRKRNGREVSVL